MILPKQSTVVLSFNGIDFSLMCEVRDITHSGEYTLWVVNGAWEGTLTQTGDFYMNTPVQPEWLARVVCAQVVPTDMHYNDALSMKPTVHSRRVVQLTLLDRGKIFVGRVKQSVEAAVSAWRKFSPHSLCPRKEGPGVMGEFDDDIPF